MHKVFIVYLLPLPHFFWKNHALRLKVGSGSNSSASHERSRGMGTEGGGMEREKAWGRGGHLAMSPEIRR